LDPGKGSKGSRGEKEGMTDGATEQEATIWVSRRTHNMCGKKKERKKTARVARHSGGGPIETLEVDGQYLPKGKRTRRGTEMKKKDRNDHEGRKTRGGGQRTIGGKGGGELIKKALGTRFTGATR